MGIKNFLLGFFKSEEEARKKMIEDAMSLLSTIEADYKQHAEQFHHETPDLNCKICINNRKIISALKAKIDQPL